MTSIRNQFPALSNKIYFNYGGQGPMPQAALDAISEAQNQIQHLGPFGQAAYDWIEAEKHSTRETIAAELNVSSATITFAENVTVGCNIAMWGIDWKNGDHMLLSDCEHHSIVAIAQQIAKRFGVEVTFCPLLATANQTVNQGDSVTVIAQYLRPNTRLVILSHILWNTGELLPIDKIAKVCTDNQTRLLVDAAQSVGSLPLNLAELGADFYAFTGHKWICGPAGVGGLYIKPEARESLNPTFIGWRSVICDAQGQPVKWNDDGRRYEIATSDYPLYTALRVAIAFHQDYATPDQRYQETCRKSQYLWEKINELPQIKSLLTSPPQTGLVSFQFKNSQPENSQLENSQPENSQHLQLVKYLESQEIFTRTILYPNCVRACVHYFTSESEIDQLVEAIQTFCISNQFRQNS